MQIFYAPGINGKTWVLEQSESKHCIRVLRMGTGTPVKLIDGRGNLFEGVISDPDPNGCKIDITRIINNFEERPWKLHIAISPLKNPERFEWFVEKSVEFGIDEITPVICKNSEKQNIKTERINNIVISAMKQSIKARLTKINPVTLFGDFIKMEHIGIKMISHCFPGEGKKSIKEIVKKGEDCLIMIGPEGDFTTAEIKSAMEHGFHEIHLGRSRLRTETAGIAACHSVYFMNQ